MSSIKDLEKKFRKIWNNKELLKTTKAVIVGISGGPDSVALLHLLYNLSSENNIRIIIAHINYGLRGINSDNDEALVRKYAKNLGLQFVSRNIKVQKNRSFQNEARKQRFDFFHEVGNKFIGNNFLVVLGHNKDDVAETFLMRAARGTSLRGLCAIKEITAYQNITIWHPLIYFTRKEIETYLTEKNISWNIDSSNLKTDYNRNFIRHRIIPKLSSIFPDTVSRIAELTFAIEQENNLLDNLAFNSIKHAIKEFTQKHMVACRSQLSDIQPALITRFILIVLHAFWKIETNLSREKLINIATNIKEMESGEHKILAEFKHFRIECSKTYIRIVNKKEDNDSSNWDLQSNILINLEQEFNQNIAQNLHINDYNLIVERFDQKTLDKIVPSEFNGFLINCDKIGNSEIKIVKKNAADKSSLDKGSFNIKKILINEKVPWFDRENLLLLIINNTISGVFWQMPDNYCCADLSKRHKIMKLSKHLWIDSSANFCLSVRCLRNKPNQLNYLNFQGY